MILLKPTLACNLHCHYCYQKNFRQYFTRYNVDRMFETAEKIFDGDLIVLHGGEPLLLPIEDIEKFLKFAYRKCGKSSVVTNGYAIDDEKIRLFKKYRTEVCVSIDGFPEMNLPRAPPEITEKIL
ncbi:MAG: radical SAM protein, partial [Archaeoglobaceae archaeon]